MTTPQRHTPPVQRGGALGGGPAGELAEFEQSKEAQRLERIAADAEIIMTLQLQSFDPNTPEWEEFSTALIEYGFEVFRVWGETGRLRSRAFQHAGGRGVRGKERVPEGLYLTNEQAIGLAIDLNLVAIEAFRKTLADPKRTWKVDGGASVKTYYTGRCLMELPDVYEKWERQDTFDVQYLDDPNGDFEMHPRWAARPEAAVEAAEARLERRAEIEASVPDEDAREILELMDQDYTQGEIAELMSEATGRDYTVGAVESRLHRTRKEATLHLERSLRELPR